MNELRVDIRLKETYKKKLARSRLKWTGHVERMRDENWQRDQMPRKWKGKEARKTENPTEGLHQEGSGKSGRRMKNNSNRYIELETAGRERNEKKMTKKDEKRIRPTLTLATFNLVKTNSVLHPLTLGCVDDNPRGLLNPTEGEAAMLTAKVMFHENCTSKYSYVGTLPRTAKQQLQEPIDRQLRAR